MNEEFAKVEVSKRVIAGLIDVAVFIIIFVLLKEWVMLGPYWASFIAGIYILTRDGLFQGQSVGKKVVKLKVINRETKKAATYQESIKRNAIFYLPNILRFSLVLGVLTGLAVLIIEAYLVSTDERGYRWGDNFAKTQVVEEEALVA